MQPPAPTPAQAGTSAAGAAAGNATANGSSYLKVGWVLQLMNWSPHGTENIITAEEFSSALTNSALAPLANDIDFRTPRGSNALRAMLSPELAEGLMNRLNGFSDGLSYFDLFPLQRGTCYEHQWSRYQELLTVWRWSAPEVAEANRRVLCNACTGSGKSGLIAMAPFAGAHSRVLVVVPNLTLLDQMKSTLEDTEDQSSAFLSSRGCLAGKPMPRTFILNSSVRMEDILPQVRKANVVITNIQCIQSTKSPTGSKRNADDPAEKPRPRLDLLKNQAEADGKPLFDLIVFDEAHHMIKAWTWKHTWESLGEPWPQVKMLATTATPFNSNEQKVECDHELTAFTLLDGISVRPTTTKNLVFLTMDYVSSKDVIYLSKDTVTRVGSHLIMHGT